MPPRIRLVFATLSLVLFFVASISLYRELAQRSDIWWTPHAMLVPLAESTDRVEIYARGKPLAALLQAGQLRIAEPMLLVYAAACGVTGCMFLLVLTGRLAYRGERERRGSSA